MYSLDTTFVYQQYYLIQKDLYAKGIGYALGVVGFLELFRSQVSEMNVLQLVPGFYLILLFISFLVLVNLSNLLLTISSEVDIRKAGGSKTLNKIEVLLLVKFGFVILFTGLLVAFNTLVPLSFDSFDSYGETTLEDVWSFDEIIGLETILIFFLVILAQVPVIAVIEFDNRSRTFDNASATPIRMATCVSWPHACMTPDSLPAQVVFTFDVKGRSTSSVTGSASMSARKATTGPGLPPFSSATMPVCATPVWTSNPSALRCSATMPDVRNSRLPSSGFWWMSCRHSITLGSIWSANRSRSLCRSAANAGAPRHSRKAVADRGEVGTMSS